MTIALYFAGAIIIGSFVRWMVIYFGSDTASTAMQGNGPFMTLLACMWMGVLLFIACALTQLQP